MQLITTVVKAGFVAFIAVLPFAMWPFTDSVELSNFSSTVSPRQTTLSLQISAVLLGVMWAYNGWHGITPLAEEVREPQRNIPLALIGGIGILMALYVGANIAYHAVLPMSTMAGFGEKASEEMARRLLGDLGKQGMAAVIMCSTFGAINSTILQTPRIAFAMARDKVFFQSLGKVHATYRTPAPAILVLAVMSIGLIAAAGLGRWLARDVDPASFPGELLPKIVGSLQNNTIFGLLTNFVIFSASIFYTLGVLAVVVLRIRQPKTERPYRTLGYPLTPLVFIAVYVWFLYQVYWSNPLEAHTGLVAIAAGLPFYFGYRWWVGRSSG